MGSMPSRLFVCATASFIFPPVVPSLPSPRSPSPVMSSSSSSSSSLSAAAASQQPSALQIYFCASIRGGAVSKPLLHALIAHMQEKHGKVLTEHIGLDTCEKESTTDEAIYARDMAWLRESEVVVAECSSPR